MSRQEARRRARSRSRLFKATVALLTLVVLGLAGVAIVGYANLRWMRASDAAGTEALATARAVAVDMLSYNHATIEEDLARAESYTTGELTDHYQRLSETLVPSAKRQQAVQQASVVDAAVEAAEPDRVRVVLFVNMSVTRVVSGEPEPRTEASQSRARFVMVKEDSRWLVAELSTLLGSVPSE
ncbi:hypothetical protein Misp01_56410 [Microtetraspora sp. NBRC 13810]|uniref:hypothetical protein n=1 Tax=Microtetraspora sp. NBRC 13810 TaxID=3030990 RepID=UPI0024A51CBD|nr:hypothetical protein [Microtetraspora sp. NBRC 13810]GLW10513.1 hypothetical protein Misp01_56410 [Microtetraspora sp. NBRC 13810]